MPQIPPARRGAPDLRSPARFLAWIARGQLRNICSGAAFGIVWMGSQALIPAALGQAIEAVVRASRPELVRWSLVVLGLGIVQAVAGVLRHRRAVWNFLLSASRVQLLVAAKASELGGDLARHVDAGEVANLGATDVERIGSVLDVTARLSGAVVSYLAVAAILLFESPLLGTVVVLGVPAALLVNGPLTRPLERRQTDEREARAVASSLAADTVVGLRILRGLGGEGVFTDRFRAASQRVRLASVRTAFSQANFEALQILLPGLLLVAVTWLGARMAISGSITTGQLVAYYAYVAFLVVPMSTFTEAAKYWTAGRVAASRVLSVLRREPELADVSQEGGATGHAPHAEGGGDLVDETTGLRAGAGLLTAVVTSDPGEASALADRLGRYADPDEGLEVRLGGRPLREMARAEVRRRVLVVPREPIMLAGKVSAILDPPRATLGTGRGGPQLGAALAAVSAVDIVEGLADGLASELPERGRSLSGGQRQRLVLAQAIVADPEVLVLDDPTSAVDAHTEAAIAAGLRDVRAGRTTVVLTTSPLVLERADRVVLVEGKVQAEGSHHELLAGDSAYRDIVLRGVA